MVEKSDRAPLLDWEEVPPAEKRVPTPEQEKDVKGPSPANNRALGCTAPGIGWSTSPGGPGSFTSAVSSIDTSLSSRSTVPTLAEWDAQCLDKDDHTPAPGQGEVPHDIMVKWEEKDPIVAVFVVTFDTRSGESSRDLGSFFVLCCCLENGHTCMVTLVYQFVTAIGL